MSDYKVTDSELTGIANAIRTKGGTSSQLVFPDGFTSAIGAIPTGGGSTLITKNITQNGTYDAEDDDADGYSSVVVNVSGGGGSTVAKVNVTYPAGSVVTATDGTTTLTSDTSGEYDFYLPNIGQWTFTCGDAVKTLNILENAILLLDFLYWHGAGSSSFDGESTFHLTGVYGNYQIAIISINGEASTKNLSPTAIFRSGGADSPISLNSLLYQSYDSGRSGNLRNMRLSVGTVNLTGDDYINVVITDTGNYTMTILAILPNGSISSVNEVRSSDGARIITSFPATSNVQKVLYGFINGRSDIATATCNIEENYIAGETIDTGDGFRSYGAGYIFGVS